MQSALFGATGFLGSHVAEVLVTSGHAVTACVRDTSDVSALVALGVAIERTDFGNIGDLARAIGNAEVVFNCIADVRLHKPLETYRETDVAVTRRVAEAAVAAGSARFVQLSTVEVYGHPREKLPFDEATPCAPEFPYQQASCEREQVLLELAARTNLHVILLRPASAIGPRNPPLERLAKAHAQGRFPVIGSGAVPFSAVDARDIARAMLWLAEHAPPDEGIYLLRAFETSWLELKDVMDRLRNKRTKVQRLPASLAYAIARVLEWTTPYTKEPIFTRFVVRLLTTPHLYDDSKLRATGFVPRYGLEESIARLLEPIASRKAPEA
jgi:nucleoside-diphosphate-sugar epimerase